MQELELRGGRASRLKRLCVLACVALLAACGGGGGSSSSPEPGPSAPPTPPPNPSGQLSATPDKIVLSAGQGEGQSVLKAYNLKDVSGQVAITLPDGSTLLAKEGATVPVMAKLGDNLYQLTDDKTVLAKVTVTVSCDPRLEPDANNVCQTMAVPPKVDHYDQVTIMSDSGIPAIAGPDMLPITAKNDTGWEAPRGFPISMCLKSEEPQADGTYLVLCAIAAADGDLKPLTWHITENRLIRFEGSLPAGYEYSSDNGGITWKLGPKWHGCQRYCDTSWSADVAPYTDNKLLMSAWAPLKQGGYLFVGDRTADLSYVSPKGEVTLLKSYNGTEILPGYDHSGFGWMATISH